MVKSTHTVKDNMKGNKVSFPELSLPSGGGAIRGIGETFQPEPFSGSGSLSIPIYVSPCRSFEPKLSLNYSSGSGNGIFGMGFSLSLSKISRRTDKGIPKYDDSDIFIFADEEVLVPRINKNGDGAFTKDQSLIEQDGVSWCITTYLPRIEEMFAKIEYWKSANSSYWKVVDRENTTSIYGQSESARITDPLDKTRIFQWLIEHTWDAKGNKVEYSYKQENNDNLPSVIYEQNRTNTTNTYIERIQYGNYFDTDGQEKWAFEVIFDYGEYDISDEFLAAPGSDPYNPVGRWNARIDPFSSYRSGFEIRTRRLCQNILLFHHCEKELGNNPYLARATRLQYQASSEMSFLTGVVITGFRSRDDSSYDSKSMPPLTFTYTSFHPTSQSFQPLLIENGDSLPGYPSGSEYHFIDLFGEGIPGFLYSDDKTTFYWKPKGDGEYDSRKQPDPFPIDRDLREEEYALLSLEGNGKLELVVSSTERAGFYESNSDGSWEPYRRFQSFPSDYENSQKEWVDMEGDGLTDLLIFEENTMKFYPSFGKEGYGATITTLIPDRDFPTIKNEYAEEVISFTDMFGDNLSHRIRIRNGSVECWPNLGYGLFGKGIQFANAPWFGEKLDPSRLFLVDLNGSGTTDIVYVYPDRVDLYLNHCGNSFSDPICIPLPEIFASLDRITFADVKGNGTSCLIFTKMESGVRHYYYDFADKMKPYLLTRIDNKMGTTTSITYSSSVKSYLEDQKAGNPWKTKLPFPVSVVEKVESIDWLSGTKLTTGYQYHDGYYDFVEKEFQGFGFVEQWDTEAFELTGKDLPGDSLITTNDAETYVPPVYVKRWYHTGAYVEAGVITKQYKADYYGKDTKDYSMPDSTVDPLIDSSDTETIRQTYRALKGQLLREEIYAIDQKQELADNPYTVTESTYQVRQIQPKHDQPYAVFFVHENETITYDYERNSVDPRVEHEFTFEVDDFGNITKSCSIYYPRRVLTCDDSSASLSSVIYPEQTQLRAEAQVNTYLNETNGFWLIGLTKESRTFEMGGLELGDPLYFSYSLLQHQLDCALTEIINPDDTFTPGQKQARTLSWERVYYWNQEQDAPLPLGSVTERGLPHHREEAVFTPELLTKIFEEKVTNEILETECGYCLQDGYWWNRGLVQHFCKAGDKKFFLPQKLENSFAPNTSTLFVKTVVEYDPYSLVPIRSTQYLSDQLTNVVNVSVDYAAMQFKQITDINDNVSQVLFDPLGMVIATSLYGTIDGKNVGDGDLAKYQIQQESTFADVLINPEKYLQDASTFFYYDLFAWSEKGKPSCAINLYRETHLTEQTSDTQNRIHMLITYLDGFGRVIETKSKIEPGQAIIRDGAGHVVYDSAYRIIQNDTEERWLVSGRTVFNNKGMPAKQFQPYFSSTPIYEEQSDVESLLPPPTVTHHDPLLRVVQVDTPKGFFSKTEFTPWQEKHFDENDTIKDAECYKNFMKNYPSNPSQEQKDEKDALNKAANSYGTPETRILNNTGNPFLLIQNNLGELSANAFADIVRGTTTSSEEIWNDLNRKGYLETIDPASSAAWVTEKFQPYSQDFKLDWDQAYQPWEDQIISILKENCLTTYHALDIEGNLLTSIDPRLYFSNCKNQTDYFSFIYQYDLLGHPLAVNSADSGIKLTLSNIFGNPAHEWNNRGFHTRITYDSFQRPVEIHVDGMDNKGLVLNQSVEKFVYGESYGEKPEEAKQKNLLGHLYLHYDQAGLVHNILFDIQNNVMQTTRQLYSDYKREVNWDQIDHVQLEQETFITSYTYDALGRIASETTPDESVYIPRYNLAGKIQKLDVTFKDGNQQTFITDSEYNANSQLLQITYGNGVVTQYSYEDTTSHLIRLLSSRTATDGKGIQRNSVLQNIVYAYDPVGNITRVRDTSQQTVFCNQQIVEPVNDYTYNGLYQLISASGHQHPGILADTHQGGFKQSIFANLCSANPNDTEKLENYRETYTYDDSGNLTAIRHSAQSASWTRELEIAANSNRTVQVSAKNGAVNSSKTDYDASGNLITLENMRNISWNYRNNIAQADIILRENNSSDSSYYTYDSSGQRVRKVVERKISDTITEIIEMIYLGSLDIKRMKRKTDNSETVILDRQTLHVKDHRQCIAVINFWLTDQSQRETDKITDRRFRFQLSDHLGSSCLEADEQANVISYEEYFPYGGTSIIAGDNEREVALKTYRYCGKERDDCTGLYYYGARYYPPWLGRWLNPDPAGTADGLNLYAFVGGNPISFIDIGGKAKGKSVAQRKKEQKKAHVNFKKAKEKFMDFGSGNAASKQQMIGSVRGGRSLRVTTNRVKAVTKTFQKDMDRSKVKLDQFAAPPSTSAPVPSNVEDPKGAQGNFFFGGKHLYVEKQHVVTKASLNVDGRDSTNATMAQAMTSYNGNNLPANQYSGRDDSGKGGLGEAWCHLVAHCLGGPESADNLVAGSQGSNLVQLGIERAIKSFITKTGKALIIKVGANVRVKTDGTVTHIADDFHYQIFDQNNKQIYNTKFQADILRADTIQKDKETEVTKSLYQHFHLKLKKAS